MTCIRDGNTYKRHNYCEGKCKGCGKEQQTTMDYADHILAAAEEGDGHEQIPEVNTSSSDALPEPVVEG